MKKFTNNLFSYALLAGLFFAVSASPTQSSEKIDPLQPRVTILDKSRASNQLPDIINDNFATRGAGFNGRYVFVASRQMGDHVYYWDITTPEAGPQELSIVGVSGGTFTLSDLTVVNNHVFASNMASSGSFKVYHWSSLTANPVVLLNYTTSVRLGDAITVIGNPENEAWLIASAWSTKVHYMWQIKNGQIAETTPIVLDVVTLLGGAAMANFSRITATPDGYKLLSGPSTGVALLHDVDNDGVLDIPVSIEANFFPDWPMYANIFNYNGGRYLSFISVSDGGKNILYVADISQGNDDIEALMALKEGQFASRVVYSVDLGTQANGNASVSMDIFEDTGGNIWLMAFAAGNGFIVQKIGDAEAPVVFDLPFVENFDGAGDGTPRSWLPAEWSSLDSDNDGFNWEWEEFIDGDFYETYMISFSWDEGTDEALTPDNWLITPKINLQKQSDTDKIELKFHITSIANEEEFRAEKYEVLVSTSGRAIEDFTKVWEETLPEDVTNYEWQERKIDLTGYAGSVVHIAFRHHGSTNLYGIALEWVQVNVIEEEPVSVFEPRVDQNIVKVFPNPASEAFTIQSESPITRIMISDITGRVVKDIEGLGNVQRLQTSGMNNGIYVVSIYNENGVSVRKLQIQR